MTARPTAVLTENDVVCILERLNAGEYQHSIAASFGVSVKTISRIKTGETWSDVTQRYKVKHTLRRIDRPVVYLTPISLGTLDLIDKVVAVKNHFGFSFEHPLHWGWFDGWDGLHSLVSDGITVWESADLVKYAQEIATSGINDHPVWADKARELPTFGLEDMMTMPIGDEFRVDMETGGIVKLVCPARGNEVFLHSRFVNIARRMKLEIRQAGKERNFVYLTKRKPRSPVDPLHIVISCVATIHV